MKATVSNTWNPYNCRHRDELLTSRFIAAPSPPSQLQHSSSTHSCPLSKLVSIGLFMVRWVCNIAVHPCGIMFIKVSRLLIVPPLFIAQPHLPKPIWSTQCKTSLIHHIHPRFKVIQRNTRLTALTRLLCDVEKTSLILNSKELWASIVKFVTISIDKRLCALCWVSFMMLKKVYTNCNHACFLDVLFVHYRLIHKN